MSTDALHELINAAGLRALGARLVCDELIIFPVRHHSPACALHLLRLFAARPPCAVLVEGPRSFTPLIEALTHADARAPLAIYAYAVQQAESDAAEVDGKAERRQAAYYPFCDYSPELVALREAKRLDIPARFIDLDFAEQALLEAAPRPDSDEDEARSLLDERHYRRSHYLSALAVRLGCRDHEELWEHLFEVSAPELTLDQHIEHLAAYCALARADTRAEALAAEGTVQREAEMAWHIRQALAERKPGDGPVLAVMGGFHAVAMPDLLARPCTRPTLPKAKVSDTAAALIRYSFERLDRLNGYAAGMTSPAWHQRLWEQLQKHERAGVSGVVRLRREAALATLYEMAAELRARHGLPLPMPALGAAYEQALGLAALRGRAAPVRDDVMDAVTSCFIKGDADADGQLVRAVALRLLGGDRMGAVPAGTASPPLVKDFQFRARRQRLKIDDSQRRHLVLDIYRREEHRLTSRLLHGLSLLEIPFALRTAGPDFVNGTGLDRLQEHWEYLHTPMTEAALVEASVHGVTVPLAVAHRFGTQLERLRADGSNADARAAAGALVQACVLGLHDHLPRVLALLRQAIAFDAGFEGVAAAAASLGLLGEAREPLAARTIPELRDVLQAAYERAIYLAGDALAAGDGGGMLAALAQLRELLGSAAGATLDAALYWRMVESLLHRHSQPLVRGAAAGLLYGAGYLDEETLGAALHGHLDSLLQPREAVAFLRGLLQTAREAAWQQANLLQVLDTLLSRWDEADFIANLPELRLAFAGMTPRETDRIAGAVAGLYGGETLGTPVHHDLDAAQLQANLALSRAVREVLAADGLELWGGAHV
ncbi:MAG: DUF5682 family protein [Pseudomonadota bacterium]